MPRPRVTKKIISATKIFVDRLEPLEHFKKTAANIPKDSVELLIYYGVGGQGKTALRKQFEEVLKNEVEFSNIHSAVLDLHERKTIDPDLALLYIRNELSQSRKVSFPAFDLMFSFYWQKIYPERQMPEFPNNWLEGGIESASDIITETSKVALEGVMGAAAEAVPLIGGVLKRRVTQGIKWGQKKWSLTNKAIKTAFPNGIPDDPAEIEEQLPYLLASDMEAHLDKDENRRFVIFIDEYERIFDERGFASKTRNNPFDKAVRDLVTKLKGTLVVIMSREQLPWAEFAPESISGSEWRNWIIEAHHRLEGLLPVDAEKFLLAVPVPENNIRQAIIDGSGAKLGEGEENLTYPLLLDLQVDHYVNLKTHDEHHLRPEEFVIQAESFRDLRNKLFLRLLQDHGLSFESTLKRLSVARYFDRELFEHLVKKFVTGFPLDRFVELTEMSFVEETKTENIFKIHNSIREALQEYLSPEDLTKTHEILVEHYTPLATPADCKSITNANIDALIELVYHRCFFSPEHLVDWWCEFSIPYTDGAIVRPLNQSLRLILDTVEKALGQEHPDTVVSLNNLAINLYSQGQYVRAQPLLERALKICESTLGLGHPDTATSLNNLASNLGNQGQYVQAQPLFERALKISESTLGLENPRTATYLDNLAMNLDSQGQYVQAQPLFERALKISESTLGPEHLDTAKNLNNLAFNLDSQGQYVQAQPLFERALKICESTQGPEHPDTATCLNNLASNLGNQGQYIQAQPLIKRALKICESTLGPEHPATATSLNNLAFNLGNQGQYVQAQPLFERALKIRESTLGPEHPDTATSLNNLAINLTKQGQYVQAQPLLKRALKICESTLGPEHPATATSLNNLAFNLDSQGQYVQAQPLFERALKIRESAQGPEHPATVTSLNNLAMNLDFQGLHEQAETYRERVRKYYGKEQHSPDSPGKE
ncbi:tetratricopeptide repeat protein [Methanosphaerula subterraneus]|uniref:tetratricopeptide repeat protein n=1 Tax=Methanosphaerula subterraneus TaxID=3350244 RepID=UPI003F85944E